MAVEVIPLTLPRDCKRFVRSWWRIYEGEPGWVPPLLMDRQKFLDPGRNPYFKYATVQLFLARKDGQDVGTIAATVDHEAQKHTPGMGFLGFFEFIEDEAVARALLDAACAWLRARGMREVQGPFNFNTNHEFGMLIDGFDTPACLSNPHGRPYYGPMADRLGLVKARDWYAYWLTAGAVPDTIAQISSRFLARNPGVTLRRVDLAHFAREVSIFREIYNDAWEENWGHVYLSEDQFQALATDFKAVINPDLCWIAEVDGEPAALSITLPDYNQVFKRMNGHLLPFGWWYFVRHKAYINQLRVLILGVKRKFQKMPLGAPLYIKTWEEGMKLGVRGAEASLILEDNHRMRGALERLGGRVYKTYRVYRLPL